MGKASSHFCAGFVNHKTVDGLNAFLSISDANSEIWASEGKYKIKKNNPKSLDNLTIIWIEIVL